MKEEKEKKKGLLIGIVVAILAVLILAFALIKGQNEYRSIKVYEINGEALVIQNGEEIQAFENMLLSSGDKVLMSKGNMTIKLDEDKYIRVEESSELEIYASGNVNSNKTSINLVKGSITNDVENKLSDSSIYEINTPNATMGVRGTTFYISADESCVDKLVVFEGTVAVNGKADDLDNVQDTQLIEKGFQVTVLKDVNSDALKQEIQYTELPKTAILFAVDKVETDTANDIIDKAIAVGAITEEDLENRENILKQVEVTPVVKETVCPECDGSGITNCDECNNTGLTTCSICNGTGLDSETCDWCKGSGICNACNGLGKTELNNSDEMLECYLCAGDGKCASCLGTGYNPCHRCNNREGNNEHVGMEVCQKCVGHSGEPCFNCGGSGKINN